MPDIEALWTIEFESNMQVTGSGTVVIETNQIFGGDAQYFYNGTFNVRDDILTAEVRAVHYSGEPFSIFGHRQRLTVHLSGEIADDTFVLEGHLDENPNATMTVRLTKQVDLP